MDFSTNARMLAGVKRFLAILSLLLAAASLSAQQKKTPPSPPDDGWEFGPVEDWVNENIDPDVLRALGELDDQKVTRVFSELAQAMKGTNIYQLGTLREAAAEAIPLLKKYEETAPYGDWLRTQLDYLDAARELRREAVAVARKTTVPKVTVPVPPPPAPTVKMVRHVWVEELTQRPWPAEARDYVPQLKKVFAAEGAPPELVWVAEVESAFKPSVRSPAGAAGMFQLMPQTARDERLSLWPWDERLQPEKSAHAAARYLRALHSHYGDWELALAAYNAGAGRIDKLLKQQKAHSFDAIARRLPAETQLYVPKVGATIRLREGCELQDLKAPKG